MKDIKNYSDACKKLNIEELTIENFSFLPTSQQENAFARHVFLTCKQAVLGDFKPDYSNYNELKYEIYGYHEDSSFSFFCFSRFSYCGAGSDFAFPDKQTAEYLIEICKSQLQTIYR